MAGSWIWGPGPSSKIEAFYLTFLKKMFFYGILDLVLEPLKQVGGQMSQGLFEGPLKQVGEQMSQGLFEGARCQTQVSDGL